MRRAPAVAGFFYADDPDGLAADVDRFVEDGMGPSDAAPPKAVIAPHAGYRYSGPIAGSAYAALARRAADIERVVLLGPAHRVPLSGLAAPSVAVFETPLGDVRVDATARDRLAEHPAVQVHDHAHADEHSVEVHLPFMQRTLGDVDVLPLVVGKAAPGTVADVLERLWGGPETAIVVSSDLSHYEDHATASELDRATSGTIADLSPSLVSTDACGAHPVNGLLTVARRRGMTPSVLDVRNSGDTTGPKDRVVGYGAYAFVEPEPLALSEDDRRALLAVARAAVADEVGRKVPRPPTPASLEPKRAAFVTLTEDGELRGCIGDLEPSSGVGEAVARHARRACHDPRLPPVTADQVDRLDIGISVLGPLERLDVDHRDDLLARLEPGEDGLMLRSGETRATFLPSVWAKLPDPERFVAHLLHKGGWPADRVDLGDFAVYRYVVEHYGAE